MSWQLRRLPVCASTEIELDRWLEQRQASALPQEWLAVAARRQRFGHGQQGRPWLSPEGGLWLSAAIPWAGALPGTASLGLAVAVGLAQQLEALGLAVRLKWPNDLLVGDRKIAGLLPRLRLRGQRIRAAQVGVGLNGCNRVPPRALSVAEATPRRDQSACCPGCLPAWSGPLPMPTSLARCAPQPRPGCGALGRAGCTTVSFGRCWVCTPMAACASAGRGESWTCGATSKAVPGYRPKQPAFLQFSNARSPATGAGPLIPCCLKL